MSTGLLKAGVVLLGGTFRNTTESLVSTSFEAGRTRQSQFLLKRKAREECFDLVNWSWSWSGHWVLLNLNHTCDFIIS